jgi:hypothetical protein
MQRRPTADPEAEYAVGYKKPPLHEIRAAAER